MTTSPARIPAIAVTTDTVHVLSFNQLRANPDAWTALRMWCADHGLVDSEVLVTEPIIRDEYRKEIRYTTGVRRMGAVVRQRVTHKLTKPPAPWPAALVELAERTRA